MATERTVIVPPTGIPHELTPRLIRLLCAPEGDAVALAEREAAQELQAEGGQR